MLVLLVHLSCGVASPLAPPRVNDATIAKARAYFALGNRVPQQLGPTNAADLREALSEDFEFVAPLVGPLGKEALIGATASLDLEAAIPDFDARYHDFRIDADDPNRVWCTMRCRGTHTGTLNFGGIQAEAKSPPVAFESPPEAVSLRFDGAGKLREITTGYPMDRRVGTTGGLGGLFGVLEGIGVPLPPVVTRSCGDLLGPALRLLRLAPPPPEPSLLEVPRLATSDALSEERLLELCAALLETDYGAERPELLADSFTFTGPVVGPLRKAEFLSSYGESNLREAFPDLEYSYRDVRVCPFDVNRVWYTYSRSGTHSATLRLLGSSYPPTGKRWEAPPECGSAQFDTEGRCVALTGGYVMDRRMGNTEGLGGLFGMCVALGIPTPYPAWLVRTPQQNWQRLLASR
uniref:SnoaL-like domain-containing protein n=1 Tax=Emiliania huxleyi TaxID=2903 RepID=A0A6V2NDS0_EMIHU|mmetsp:Transcript_6294/g.18266  ORF Transcript_6294/g.18266 Transcript_6294/m.18266 type:complete len:406 (-) Transcript_6294:80-1297(-)